MTFVAALRWALCLSLLWLPLVAVAQSGVSALEMSKEAENQFLTLSPDAAHIAFVTSKTDKYCFDKKGQMKSEGNTKCSDRNQEYRARHRIVIYNLERSETIQSLELPENFLVTWLNWASEGRLLASIHKPTTLRRNGLYGKIGGEKVMSIPLTGLDFFFLFGDQKIVARENRYQSKIADVLPSDPDHIIMPGTDGSNYSLWKVNILTGKGHVIADGELGTFAWFTDPGGLPSLRFDCEDGRYCPRVSVNVRQEGTDGSQKADWQRVMLFEVKKFEDREDYDFWPLAPAAKPGQYYILADSDDDSTAHIKLYDVIQRKYVETVYQNPDLDVSGALFSSGEKAYLGAYYYDDSLKYVFDHPDIQKHYARIRQNFEAEDNVRLQSFNAAQGRAIVSVSAPNISGDYYIYDFESGKVSFLLQRYPELYDKLHTETELLDVTTRDGQKIRAYLTKPQDSDGADKPLIVMPHGGPEARDFHDYNPWLQYIANNGYRVLQVNFRGSAGYGREFAREGDGEWGGVMQNDVIDAVNMLYDSGRATRDKTCMVGYSYGGYVALMAGATTPDMFKCIVAGAGDSDLEFAIEAAKDQYGKNSVAYEYWLKSIGDPKADKEKLKALSPINMADKFQAPVLLLHGSFDRVVRSTSSVKMNKALKRAGKSVTYVNLESEGHNDWSVENEVLFLESIKEFLDQHIGE